MLSNSNNLISKTGIVYLTVNSKQSAQVRSGSSLSSTQTVMKWGTLVPDTRLQVGRRKEILSSAGGV